MQFASDLDEETKERIESGRKYVELLKQKQNDPMPFFKQVVILYAANNGLFTGARVDDTRTIEAKYLEFVDREYDSLFTRIESGRELTDPIVADLDKSIREFKDAHSDFYGQEADE